MNSYYTEQYVGSVLNQYQQNSGQNSPLKRNVSQNCQQFIQNNNNNWFQNEETKRRLLNESLFKNIDKNLYSRPLITTISPQKSVSNVSEERVRNPSLNTGYNPNVANTSRVLPQNDRQESVDKNWVQKNTTSEPIRTEFQNRSSSIRTYYGQSLPQTHNRSQFNTYRAKVIDYSIKDSDLSKGDYQRLDSNRGLKSGSLSTSVLTEQNTDPILFRPNQSFTSQSIPMTTSKEIVTNVIPKPTLKRKLETINTQSAKLLFKPNQEVTQNPFSVNTTAIRQSYSTGNPISKPQNSSTIQSKQPIVRQQTQPIARQQFQPNARFRDTFLTGFESEGILKTFDMDRNEIYYCYYCNNYIKKLATVEKHCKIGAHLSNVLRGHCYQSGLNKNIVSSEIRLVDGVKSSGLLPQTVLRMELDRIPIDLKHYYYRKGIRLKELSGINSYYCKFCQKSIQSLESIENHLFSESHRRVEDRPTFNKFLSQTTEPITGLQFITEYLSPDLAQPVYECLLCKCFEDAYEMYLHVCSFKHRINLLKQFNPNEVSLKFITETPQAVKEVVKRISDLHLMSGTGTIKKINNKPPDQKTTPPKTRQNRKPSVEVIDIIDDEVEVSQEKSEVEKLFSVKLLTEDEAADAAILIQSLKEAVVKYYLDQIPAHMRKVLMSKVIEEEDFDNYEFTSMDTSF